MRDKKVRLSVTIASMTTHEFMTRLELVNVKPVETCGGYDLYRPKTRIRTQLINDLPGMEITSTGRHGRAYYKCKLDHGYAEISGAVKKEELCDLEVQVFATRMKSTTNC